MSYRGNRHSSPNPARGKRGGQRSQGSRGRGRGGSRVGSGACSPLAEQLNDNNQPQNQSSPSTSRGRGGQGHRSGFSSPRGYPSRKKIIQPKPAALLHGGIGSHLLVSLIDSCSLSPLPRSQGLLRGQSDPRLLVPVKFVKATALTDKSLEKPTNAKLQDESVFIAGQVEKQTASSEARSPGNSFNQELSVEVSNPPLSSTARRAPVPMKTAFNPADQTFQIEMEEITEEAANRWQSQSAGLAKVDDEPTKTAIVSIKQDYHLEMEETTNEALRHWQSQFPGLVAFGLVPKSCQTRDHPLHQALGSESLKPILNDDGNDPISQSIQDEKSETLASQPIAKVQPMVPDASILIDPYNAAQPTSNTQLEGLSIERTTEESSEVLSSPASHFTPKPLAVVFQKDGAAQQPSEILQSVAGDLVLDSLAVVSLNDHWPVGDSEISTTAAAYPTADSQVVASSTDKTEENSGIAPSVAAHSPIDAPVEAYSIAHGGDESVEIAPDSQVAHPMIGHPTDKSLPTQSIKQDAQPMLLHQASATDTSGVLVTPAAINDGVTVSLASTGLNAAKPSSAVTEPQPAVLEVPEAAPSSLFLIDSEGDRNILSSLFNQQDANPCSPDEDADDEDEDQIVFKPSIILPSCNPPTETSHLSRTISDPVDWVPASPANDPLQSCSTSKWPKLKVIAPKDSKKAIKAAARRRKALRKRNTRQAAKSSMGDFTGLDYRCLIAAKDISDQSDIDWGDTDVQPEHAPAQPPKGATLTPRARKHLRKQKEEMEILADYMMHTVMSEDESVEESENKDQGLSLTRKNSNGKSLANDSFFKTFLAGMQTRGHQTTIDELEEQAQEQSDDEHLDQGGWNTDRSSSLDEQIEALDSDLSEENSEVDSNEDDDEEPVDNMSRKGKSCQAKSAGDAFASSTDVNQVSDDDMIDNDDGWGHEPNGNASHNSSKIIENDGGASEFTTPPIMRSTHQTKAKLKAHWVALQKGRVWKRHGGIEKHTPTEMERLAPDFDSDSESPDSDSDASPDLPVLTKSVLASKKKGKGKQRKSGPFPGSDDELINFIEDIQAQWAADRARKADRKRERAEARLLNPPKTKKQRKKATRRDTFDGCPEPDLSWLNDSIKEFIHSPDRSSYALPPLRKKTRARIHLLANVYGLKSHSLGSGPTRHPVLERTHRTTLANVNKKKVNDILFGQSFSRYHQQYDDDNLKSSRKSTGRPRPSDYQQSISTPRLQKTRDGMLVGGGVEHLGEDNIGFKLLAKMGWSMGQSIGSPNNQSALQQPLMAVMKSTKGGLGLSSQRFEY